MLNLDLQSADEIREGSSIVIGGRVLPVQEASRNLFQAHDRLLEIQEAAAIRSISQDRLRALKDVREYRDQLKSQVSYLSTLVSESEGKIIDALDRGHEPEPGELRVRVETAIGRISRSWKKAALYFAAKLGVAPDQAEACAEKHGNGRSERRELRIEA